MDKRTIALMTDSEIERNEILSQWFNHTYTNFWLSRISRLNDFIKQRMLIQDIRQEIFERLMLLPVDTLRHLNNSGKWMGYVKKAIMFQHDSPLYLGETRRAKKHYEFDPKIHGDCFELDQRAELEEKEDLLNDCAIEIMKLPYLQREAICLFAKYESNRDVFLEMRENGVYLTNADVNTLVSNARETICAAMLRRGAIVKRVPYVRHLKGFNKGYQSQVRPGRSSGAIARLISFLQLEYNPSWSLNEKILFILLNNGYVISTQKFSDILYSKYGERYHYTEGCSGVSSLLSGLKHAGIVFRRKKPGSFTEYYIPQFLIEYIESCRNKDFAALQQDWAINIEYVRKRKSVKAIAKKYKADEVAVAGSIKRTQNIVEKIEAQRLREHLNFN